MNNNRRCIETPAIVFTIMLHERCRLLTNDAANRIHCLKSPELQGDVDGEA